MKTSKHNHRKCLPNALCHGNGFCHENLFTWLMFSVTLVLMKSFPLQNMRELKPWKLCFMILFTFFHLYCAGDTITPNQSISDGKTIFSASGSFVLGFFSPSSGNTSNPSKRYLGIWFGKLTTQTVIWVANRENPIADTTGVLKLSGDGELILINNSSTIFWSSGKANATNPMAKLEGTGNLVIRDTRSSNNLWQSFDHPYDTFLSGMKVGWNLRTKKEWYLTSWRTVDDPSPGNYTFRTDLRGGIPHGVILKGTTLVARLGHWNGFYFTHRQGVVTDPFYTGGFISTPDEVFNLYPITPNMVSRMVLNQSGVIQRFLWQDRTKTWDLYWNYPEGKCENYNMCGSNGLCNNESPFCLCLPGFETSLPESLNIRDGSDRCVRRTPLDCKRGDGFVKVERTKMPETTNSTVNASMSLEDCRMACFKNCSCMAYALLDIKVGVGCIMWSGKLIDTMEFPGGGQDFYLRVAASEIVDSKIEDSPKRRKVVVILAPTLAGIALLFFMAGCYILKQRKKQGGLELFPSDKDRGKELHLTFFSFEKIATATGNFCDENQLGHGGFGPVFKGKLDDGQEMAVKRLSKNSLQGLDEFMTEITLIAKLQHRNLVRLLGCCIQRNEKMLIYEYMPKGSLNSFIFDKEKGELLDWKMRVDIILGIARGVLYLHRDSRLRIIHRDLKADNILLDEEMNPKISDFGTARIFRADQLNDQTRTVIGTHGYMSPEYVVNGIFSMKSDVFSFGVLVIEIMSGVKNRVVHGSEASLTLIGYAWKLWNEGNITELLDKNMGLSCANSEVLRCVQIGLLCVQERPEDRPQMSSVVIMLGSNATILDQPKKPGFYMPIYSHESDSSSCIFKSDSAAGVTLTEIEGR